MNEGTKIALDLEVRLKAVAALTSAPPQDAADQLLTALADSDFRIREEAIRVGSQVAERADIRSNVASSIVQGDNVGLRNAAIGLAGMLGESMIPALEKALHDAAPEAKKFLLEAIARTRSARATELLSLHLEGTDPNTKAAVIEALVNVGDEPAITMLIELLSVKDTYPRMAALSALNRMQVKIPWSVLEPLLGDRLLFRTALAALGRCGSTQALEPLVGALGDTSEHVVTESLSALDSLLAQQPTAVDRLGELLSKQSDHIIPELRRFLSHPSMRVRRAVVLALTLLRDTQAIEGVLALANASMLSDLQLKVLTQWGAQVAHALLEHHQRQDARFRGTALELISEIIRSGMPQTSSQALNDIVGRLLAAARHELAGSDMELQMSAVVVLGRYAEAQDAALLVSAALGDVLEVAELCVAPLLQLAEKHPDAMRDALANIDLATSHVPCVCELVAHLDGEHAIGRLRAALLGGDAPSRAAAVAGLGVLHTSEAVQLVALALDDEDGDVQFQAATALGRMASDGAQSQAISALLGAIASGTPALQAICARQIGSCGDARAIAPLIKLCEEADPSVQVEALGALIQLEAKGLSNLLESVVQSSDAEVVKQGLQLFLHSDPQLARTYLRQFVDDGRWDVRALAARLLASYADSDAERVLRDLLAREQDSMVRAQLEDSLKGMTRGE